MFQGKVIEIIKKHTSYFNRSPPPPPENRVVFAVRLDGSCLAEKGPGEHEDVDMNKATYRQNKFGPSYSYVAQHATCI